MRGLTGRLALFVTALGAIGGMTILSQGCTIVGNDEPLDGGHFTGNDSPALPPPQGNACNECLFQQCAGQWSVCQQNGECRAIYLCAIQPSCASSLSCVDACVAAHPQGEAMYRSLAVCDNVGECGACSSTCTRPSVCVMPDAGAPDVTPPPPDASTDDGATPIDAAPPEDAAPPVDAAPPEDAAPPVDAAPPQDCSACTDSQCAAEKNACAPMSACDQYTQCLATCMDVACIDKCGTDNPAGLAAQAALAQCVQSHCASACGY